jgi:septum formation inhibitor MinC
MLNLLAEYEIGLRQVRTTNPKVHQVAQDLGLAVTWQSPQEAGLHINAFSANDNWEVMISGRGQNPSYSVADFQMPPAIIEAIVEGVHEEKPSTSKREDKARSADPEGGIAPAVHSTLIAHPTEPDLVQRISAPPYLYRGTLRSGQIFRHAGSVIIVGDVNPGAQVVSGSDVYIWGRLRGVVHAGAMGDEKALIGALDFEPIQVRIAGHIAMSPRGEANDPGRWFWKRQPAGKPEIARVINARIVVDQWDARLPTRH